MAGRFRTEGDVGQAGVAGGAVVVEEGEGEVEAVSPLEGEGGAACELHVRFYEQVHVMPGVGLSFWVKGFWRRGGRCSCGFASLARIVICRGCGICPACSSSGRRGVWRGGRCRLIL